MWDMVPRKVLVGIETADCLPALSLAAEEAVRRGSGVHLMHVLPTIHASHPHIDELELVAGELQRAGEAVVGEAARTMQRLLPDDLVVSTELRHGTVFSCLVEASAHACLLVLQHRDTRHDGVSHLLPTIHPVVASAHCPVLVVPQTWHSEESMERPLVLAGVDDGTRSAHVAQLAMAEGARRHARVRLVHGAKDRLGGVEDNDPTAVRRVATPGATRAGGRLQRPDGQPTRCGGGAGGRPGGTCDGAGGEGPRGGRRGDGEGSSEPSVRQAPRAGHGRGAAARRMPGAGRRREPSDSRRART